MVRIPTGVVSQSESQRQFAATFNAQDIDRTSRTRHASLCADWTHALNQSDRRIPPVPIRMPEDAHEEYPETMYSTILQNKMNVLSD